MTSVVRSRTSGSKGMHQVQSQVQLETHQEHSQVSECRCPTVATPYLKNVEQLMVLVQNSRNLPFLRAPLSA
eukprot:6191809-Pleurochrysis_carterae.AAC.3